MAVHKFYPWEVLLENSLKKKICQSAYQAASHHYTAKSQVSCLKILSERILPGTKAHYLISRNLSILVSTCHKRFPLGNWEGRCDGASSLYKNCKIFLNLYDEKYFHIGVKCNFFAAVHGKNYCDEIGGTLKQLVACANLQATKRKSI